MRPKERQAWRGVVAFNVAFSAWMLAIVVWTTASIKYPGLNSLARPIENFDIVFIGLLCAGIGVLVWRWERRRVASYPRCAQCGYNLTGHMSLPADQRRHCPECGEPLTEPHIIAAAQPDLRQADRRLLRLAILAASVSTLAAAGMVVLLTCYGQFRGWEMLVLPASCAYLWTCPLLIRREQRKHPSP